MIVGALAALWLAQVNGPAPRYRIETAGGCQWLVAPDGRPFLSMGVCCVEPGATRQNDNPKNRGYAAYRNYVSTDEWASDAVRRLSDWHFNTVGAWSADAALRKPWAPQTFFTPILHMGSSAGAPWKDMWDPKTVATMDQVARDQILPLKGEGRVVGYFSDNEMGWWVGAMFEWAFRAGPASRHRVVALLRATYHDRWSSMLRDFVPQGAQSFAGLEQGGRVFLRPGGNGMVTVHAWMRIVSDRYYSLCRSMIRKYDPGALYLGDRYISNFYPEVAASAGKYCDVVSTNLNADSPDGAFIPFYLPSLHRISGRPLLITEYYQAAKENRSGNANDSSGFPVVATQAERARAFVRQTQFLIGQPYVLGAHWFQYADEPMHGRPDGENYNMGLVDIDNRPYEALTEAAARMDVNAWHRGPVSTATRAIGDLPPFPAKGAEDIGTWIRKGLCVATVEGTPRGDLFLARDADRVWLALYWNEDLFSEALYVKGNTPPGEEPIADIEVDGHKLSVPLAPAIPPASIGKAWRVHKMGVRNFVLFSVPVKGKVRRLRAVLTTRSRAYRQTWEFSAPPGK